MRRWLLGAGALLASLTGVLVLAQPAQAYTVQPGDTLWSIALRNGVTVRQLASANGLSDPNAIFPGEQITIPQTASTAGTYTVRPGDTLWSIASNLGVHVNQLLGLNAIADPDLIKPGQHLNVPGTLAPASTGPLPPGATAAPPPPISLTRARALLVAAAERHGLNPAFVLAVSYWESGFNQGWVSHDGAIGMMQILPATATWAGPSLLGRPVDLHDPYDNADLGAALLAAYLDQFDDPHLALAAYYQGARATAKDGIYPSSENYVNGIWALRNRFNSGQM